jgi:outer membrane receptor protein involved in Fe transport
MMLAVWDSISEAVLVAQGRGTSMQGARIAAFVAVVIGMALPVPVRGQTPTPQAAAAGGQKPAESAAADPTYAETVVVSASKIEQQLVDAPATMTVIGPRALEVAPSGNYADLLRNVPGLNITQISARDVNVASRGATGSLATSQLAVLDGRSLYQDFFGFVMWDFMPADLDQIKRIEVIRGPASAVWGANALNGVISVITKSPREAQGSSVTIGGGTMNREVSDNSAKAGSLFFVRASHAQAVNERLSYRITTGTFMSDALARPNGLIPNTTNTPYPAYANTGTAQPKVDMRIDYDFPDQQRKLQISGGFARTDGVMHTGIGPFDIDGGAKLGYWKLDFTKNALKVQAFMNTLDGSATNLVSVTAPAGAPLDFGFSTRTFDVELGNTTVVGTKNVFSYGGNLRVNRFDLGIAPGEKGRTEGGVYVQDEILLHDKYRLVAGARVDKFSSIDNPVFSPRVAFVVKPHTDHSVRVSYNRAFRAPSMVNNNLQTTIGTRLPLGALNPAFGSAVYYVPTTAVGNPDLTEEHIDAFEVAYTGNIGNRATISAATYYTDFKDSIFFTATGLWTTPPPGFPGLGPFPPSALWQGVLNAGFRFPSNFTYKNLGSVKSKGLELGIDGRVTDVFAAFANYAFQAEPDPTFPGLTPAQALAEINRPSRHLVNLGVSWLNERTYGTLSVSHAGKAFWQDVLDDRYHGFTDAYTVANITAGVKFQGGRYAAALKVTNLGNQEVQQHVFGDVVKRQVVGELKFTFK